jgi:hypothetical protein
LRSSVCYVVPFLIISPSSCLWNQQRLSRSAISHANWSEVTISRQVFQRPTTITSRLTVGETIEMGNASPYCPMIANMRAPFFIHGHITPCQKCYPLIIALNMGVPISRLSLFATPHGSIGVTITFNPSLVLRQRVATMGWSPHRKSAQSLSLPVGNFAFC